MKNLLMLFLLIVSFSASGQVDTLGKARIVFLRKTGFQGTVSNYSVFVDDSLAVRLSNNRYYNHYVAAGKHTISSQFMGKKESKKADQNSFEMEVESGKTYYVQVNQKVGFATSVIYCQEVTYNSVKKILSELKPEDPK